MRQWTKVAVAAVVAALLLTAVWVGVGRRNRDKGVTGPVATATSEISLAPVQADAAGVDLVTAFRLTSARPLTAAAVRQQLTVQPAVDLKIEQTDSGGHEFRVQPARALDADRIYRFQLAAAGTVSRPYGWAFQTKAPFRVLGTLPRDHSTGVPVDTGIEITFSHENYADPDAAFSITPKVAGRFERHKQTLVFVPGNPLAPGTIYTVTLKQGLGQKGADGKLTADVTFAFETQPVGGGGKGPDQVWFQVPDEVQEFPVGEAPYFQLWYQKNGTQLSPQVETSVYRYKDAATFMDALTQADKVPWWANYARSRYQEAAAGLSKVAAFKASPTAYAGVGSYLVFPEKLEAGYYLAEFSVDGSVRQSRFQVTDISSYMAVTTTQTLVWLNDLAAKAPVAGARVQVSGGGISAVTDGGGVAVLPTPAESLRDGPSGPSGLYLHVQAPGGREAVVGAQANAGNHYYARDGGPEQQALKYWRYLYLDRSLYKPDDPVNIWGVVRPREPGAAPVAQVTAEVLRSEYRDPAGQPMPLARAEIKVADGTFTGVVRLPGLQPGWYELQVKMGGEYLLSRWFEVQTYTKPAYQVAVTQDRRAIFDGDTVNFHVKTAFFDGTPVPNLNLGYSFSDGKENSTLTTDANGEANLSFKVSVPTGDRDWGGATGAWFNIRSTLPEAGEIATGASVDVYSRDVMVRPEIKVEHGLATVSASVNQVTLDRINAGEGWDVTGAPAQGRQVKGSLKLVRFNKRETGEYYDFLSKRVIKQYQYDREAKEVSTFQALTDSSGSFVQTLLVDPEESYELDLQVQDTRGRWVTRQLHFWGKAFQRFENNPYRYFVLAAPEPGKELWPSDKPATLVFQEDEKPLPDRAGSFLFLTARLGLQGYQVQDSGTFRYTLRPTDPPNTNVKGVYFDGRLYRETSERPLRLDPAERELKVTVTPEKAAYRPGETVSLKVQARDRQGRPAQAARVNLNLVDEALFALRDQRVNTLEGLYFDLVPAGLLRTRSSHHIPAPGSGAEKGGEGGGVRKDFKDAVFFATVVTDSQGRATASFKVPDNLTMWRLTWQAVAPATMEAASGTVGIPVKLPFFVAMNPGELS